MELIVVGMRFHPAYNTMAINTGAIVSVQAEPTNDVDPRALAVSFAGAKIGHIRAADINYARHSIFDKLEKNGYPSDTKVYFKVTRKATNYLLLEYHETYHSQIIEYDDSKDLLLPSKEWKLKEDIDNLNKMKQIINERLEQERHAAIKGDVKLDRDSYVAALVTNGTLPAKEYLSNATTSIGMPFDKEFPKTNNNITKQINKEENKMSFNTSTLKDSFFRELKNIAFDLQSGKLGVVTKDGISVYTGDGVSVNPITEMGFNIPAFAMRVAVADLKEGDILIGNGDPVFFKEFISDKDGKSTKGYKTVSLNGSVQEVGNVTNLFFGKNSVLAVKNMFGGDNSGGMNPMMLLAMSGAFGDGNSKIDPIMLMAMSGGFGGGSGGDMNPMMLGLLLAKK